MMGAPDELVQRAMQHCRMNEYVEAEPLFRRLVAMQHANAGVAQVEHHQPDVVYFLGHTLESLAEVENDRQRASDLLAETSDLYRQSLLRRIQAGEEAEQDTFRLTFKLGQVLYTQGRLAEAEQVLRPLRAQYEAEKVEIRNIGRRIVELHVACANQLAIQCNKRAVKSFHAGKLVKSEALCRESLEHRQRTGCDSNEMLICLQNLYTCLMRQDKHAEAEACQRDRLEILTKAKGSDHADTQISADELVDALA